MLEGLAMKKNQKNPRDKYRQRQILAGLAAVAVLLAALALAVFIQPSENERSAVVAVVRTTLSQEAAIGETVFAANCATCHGENAAGSNLGPPLIHDIYNPGHHSDQSFYLAAANGTRQHHWTFGDMPPQPQVAREDVAKIIRYIRELQEANGIISKRY